MRKTRDFDHEFVHRGAVGACRVRVYEQEGERPVVVATQGFGAFGQPEPSILVDGPQTIAADLIREGIVPESQRAITVEMLEEATKTKDLRRIRNSAPFRFVVERLVPPYQLTSLWFEGYYELMPGQIGNIVREETTRAEVEKLIGASLDD